uniref:TROVE domain-containing protein n=1 Tax=Aegilops tauschii subsp. strangulata TaxID=200361 RepID=A0A453LC36_AEGTS
PPIAIVDTDMPDRKPKAKPTPKKPKRAQLRGDSSSSDDDSDSEGDYSDAEPPRSCVSRPPKAEGKALAYASSGDPCVDFFFQVVPAATAAADVAALLSVAWAGDARTALRLVCHLRGVRGLGKSDREGFYAAALWMHANHPRTLAANLASFARFGCLKDLPEIVYRVLHGPRDERKDGDDSTRVHRRGGSRNNKRRCLGAAAEAAKARRQKETEHAQVVLARYDSDESFRFLYDRVAELFAELLKSDLEHLRSGDTAKIGLAAKWCPSLRSSYDRSTLLCEAIARRVFPRDSSPEYLSIPDKHYAYRVRNRLRREVDVPLRKVLELPEVYMIPADAVLPHEILAAALKGEHDESAELQWRHMVASLASEGRLSNCIAMCALSSSVEKPPAAAAIALGLLISELSKDPWKGRVITFDATHQLHKVRGASLVEKLRTLAAVRAQKGANLQAVFNKILNVAVAGGLSKDMMVKRVFVLSDMEFDGWVGGEAWVSEHEAIKKKFAAEGFAVPEVVFWNVGTSKASVPVVAAQAGVALVSGYSKNLVRLFLEADGVLTPSAIMADAISGPEYDALEVLD